MLDSIAMIGNGLVEEHFLLEKRIKQHIDTEFVSKKDREKLTEDSYIRVSSIPYMCPREEVWYALSTEMQNAPLERLRLVFEFGNAFQDVIRNGYLGGMKILVGEWTCACCRYTTEESKFSVMPAKCPKCSGDKFLYQEVKLISEIERISGHPDGYLEVDGVRHILEIKTCNDYFFKCFKKNGLADSLAAKYLVQVQLYMWLSGVRNSIFLFFNKNTSDMLSIKMAYNEEVVQRTLQFVRSVRESLKSKVLLECTCKKQDHAELML